MLVRTVAAAGSRPGTTNWQTSPVPEPTSVADQRDTAGPDDGDDVIVLPWWQHPVNIVTMLVAVAVIAGMLGWLIGQSSEETESSDVDVGFLQDMRVHHEQAVDMSFFYLGRPDTEPQLRTVARSIIFGQSVEIGLMSQLLDDMRAPIVNEDGQAMEWMGHAVAAAEMPGMASEQDLDRLRAAEGEEADALYVELMTAHHEGGIEMAAEAAERAENPDVRRHATSWVRGQQDEIVELEGLLADPPS
jgi:uncharacterized protein (DUF305 family)